MHWALHYSFLIPLCGRLSRENEQRNPDFRALLQDYLRSSIETIKDGNKRDRTETYLHDCIIEMCKQFLFSRSPFFSLLEPIRVRPPVNIPDTAHKVISFLFSWQNIAWKSSKILGNHLTQHAG